MYYFNQGIVSNFHLSFSYNIYSLFYFSFILINENCFSSFSLS